MDLPELRRALEVHDYARALEVYEACPPSPAEHGRALVLAAHVGDVNMVRHILVNEVSEDDLASRYMDPARPNSVVPVGDAALSTAAHHGFVDIIDELLNDGRINFNFNSRSVGHLMVANHRGQDAAVRRLLEHPPMRAVAATHARMPSRYMRRWVAQSPHPSSAFVAFLDEHEA